MLVALLRPLFTADDAETARALVGTALKGVRKPLPKVAALLEEAEEDLLAFSSFPGDHWAKLRSTNPLERSTARSAGARTWSDHLADELHHVVGRDLLRFPRKRESKVWR